MTVTRPWASQHLTWSPPTPITRLIRSFSLSEGSRPMKVRPSLTCLTTIGSCLGAVCSSASQPPGSWNTTTSPRWGLEPNHGVNLSTRTRSPIRIVCSIEPDGITNAWTRKVLRTSAIRTATPTRRGISRTAERLRLRFTLRWSLRRSARLRPGPAAAEVRRVPVGSRLSAGVPATPRGLPRLPMRGLRGGHARVRGRAVQPGQPVVRPDDPVGPADDVADGHHAAAG